MKFQETALVACVFASLSAIASAPASANDDEHCKRERDFYPNNSEVTRSVLAQPLKTRAENVAEMFRKYCASEIRDEFGQVISQLSSGRFETKWNPNTNTMTFACIGWGSTESDFSTIKTKIRDGLVRRLTFEGDFIHIQAQPSYGEYKFPGEPDYCVHHVPISVEYALIKNENILD